MLVHISITEIFNHACFQYSCVSFNRKSWCGKTYEFLFTEAPPNTPVTIAYHCDPHPWMTGTVVVGQARF